MTAQKNEMTDESLMALVQTGDHEAFSTLVRRHTNRFFICAYRMTAHVQEAEDIVQNCFVKLWKKPQGWNARNGAKFTTWFYRVVTNAALDELRRKKPQSDPAILSYIPDAGESAEEGMQKNQQEALVEEAIQNLPERQKTALNLCFYEGLGNKEAADIMGVSVKALESLLMRAKAGLRESLARQGILEVRHYG